ncbi:MAG: tetratricopeptide repeat protein [Candidatus Methylomirabilales bacterium]
MTGSSEAIAEVQASDSFAAQYAPDEAVRIGPWSMMLVLLLAATAYVECLGYQFIWDDVLMVVQNHVLRDLRNLPEFLRADFTTLTSGAIEGHYYRPTLAVTLALDATLWGLNPTGFHLTNILLHLAVTFLVSRLVLAMGAARDVAVLAALIFAIHPVHVETVAWVAARVDLLLSIGALGCLVAYRHWGVPGPGRAAWGLAALGCQGLALLSKESAVILPALLVSSDLLCSGRPRQPADGATWRRALIRSLPFWAVAALFAAFRFVAFLDIARNRLQGGGLWRRVPGALETLARYLWLTLVPTHMQPLYALARPSSFLEPWPALGMLAAAVLVALLIWWWRRAPLAAFGVAWFLVTVLPVVDVVPFSLREMALTDRYLYLPSVGISLLLALGIITLMGPVADRAVHPRRLAAWGALIVLLTVYPWHLLRYAPVWQNDLTLYGRMVQAAPGSPMANFNFGYALLRANDLPRGTAALERAVGLDPRLPRPRATLAMAYVLQGRAHDGFRIFDAVASDGPVERDYYVSRTIAHLYVGESQEALAVAEDGARRFAGDADLTQWLGRALEKAGRTAEAMEAYRQALILRPDLFQAEEALGQLLAQSGKADEAAQHFLRSAEIRPDRAQPIRALALLQEAQGNRPESLRLWRQVLELAPNGAAIREAAGRIHRLEQGDAGPGVSPTSSHPRGATGS